MTRKKIGFFVADAEVNKLDRLSLPGYFKLVFWWVGLWTNALAYFVIDAVPNKLDSLSPQRLQACLAEICQSTNTLV